MSEFDPTPPLENPYEPGLLITSSGNSYTHQLRLETVGDEAGPGINALDLWTALLNAPGEMSQKRIIFLNPDVAARHILQLADNTISLDARTFAATVHNAPLNLTAVEFEILYTLGLRAPEIMNRDELYKQATGDELASTSNMVNARIYRIRQKLGQELGNPKTGAIRTMRHVGWYAVKSLADPKR